MQLLDEDEDQEGNARRRFLEWAPSRLDSHLSALWDSAKCNKSQRCTFEWRPKSPCLFWDPLANENFHSFLFTTSQRLFTIRQWYTNNYIIICAHSNLESIIFWFIYKSKRSLWKFHLELMNLFRDELLLKAAERRQLFLENSFSLINQLFLRLFIQYNPLPHTR